MKSLQDAKRVNPSRAGDEIVKIEAGAKYSEREGERERGRKGKCQRKAVRKRVP